MASGTESDLVGLVLEGMSQGGPSAVTRHSDRAVVYVIYEEDEGTRAAVPRTRRNEEHAALQAAFSSSRAHLDIAELVVSLMLETDDVVAVLGSCSAQGRATGCRFTTPFA